MAITKYFIKSYCVVNILLNEIQKKYNLLFFGKLVKTKIAINLAKYGYDMLNDNMKIFPEMLKNIGIFEEFLCKKAVKINGHALKYIKNQTEELCLTAVMNDPSALEYVYDQTEKICLVAVNKDGLQIAHVKNQTNLMCMIAIKSEWRSIEFIKNQTDEICIEAIKRNDNAIFYIKNPTEDMYYKAIKNILKEKYDIWRIYYLFKKIENPSEKLCFKFLKANVHIFSSIKKKTLLICIKYLQTISSKNVESHHIPTDIKNTIIELYGTIDKCRCNESPALINRLLSHDKKLIKIINNKKYIYENYDLILNKYLTKNKHYNIN